MVWRLYAATRTTGSLWLTAELGSDRWSDLEGYEIADEDSDRVRAFAGRPPP